MTASATVLALPQEILDLDTEGLGNLGQGRHGGSPTAMLQSVESLRGDASLTGSGLYNALLAALACPTSLARCALPRSYKAWSILRTQRPQAR